MQSSTDTPQVHWHTTTAPTSAQAAAWRALWQRLLAPETRQPQGEHPEAVYDSKRAVTNEAAATASKAPYEQRSMDDEV
jgi:hypothetical protein